MKLFLSILLIAAPIHSIFAVEPPQNEPSDFVRAGECTLSPVPSTGRVSIEFEGAPFLSLQGYRAEAPQSDLRNAAVSGYWEWLANQRKLKQNDEEPVEVRAAVHVVAVGSSVLRLSSFPWR